MKITKFVTFLLLVALTISISACDLPAFGGDDTLGVATEVPVGAEPTLVVEIVEPTAMVPPTAIPTIVIQPTPVALLPLSGASLPAHDAVIDVFGALPKDFEEQVPIKQPGDIRVEVIYFSEAQTGVQFQRLVCDDNCNSVEIVYPDGIVKDLTSFFDWISFPAGGTGDASLDAILVARGLNIVKGEVLRQNSVAIWLGNVPAGTYITVVTQDDPKLMQNVGIAYVRFVTTSDAHTTDISGIPAK